MTIKQEGAELHVTRPNDLKENRSLHGLTRTLLHNMVVGVTDGFKKELDVKHDGDAQAAQDPGQLVGPRIDPQAGLGHPAQAGDDLLLAGVVFQGNANHAGNTYAHYRSGCGYAHPYPQRQQRQA